MKLVELLEGIKGVVDGHDLIKKTDIITAQRHLIAASEVKNNYIHASIIYDLNKIPMLEWSQKIPIRIIFSDKLKTDFSNELFIHSNTLSCATELTQLLRVHFDEVDVEGLLPGETNSELWTEQFSDALLAGTVLEFNIAADIKGFCDIK